MKIKKSERGTHTGIVRVKRDGKVFNRKQRLGKKDKGDLSDFKNSLTKMDVGELKQQISIIEDKYPIVKKSLQNWYDFQKGTSFEEEITDVFKMDLKNSGSTKSVNVDSETKEGYKKIYLVTQEYLKRTNVDDSIICYRGLGSNTYEKFKDGYPGEDIKINQRNVSSWTTDYDMANEFANRGDRGVIIETMIPNKNIFIHPGCSTKDSDDMDESEIILMGKSFDCTISELFGDDDD